MRYRCFSLLLLTFILGVSFAAVAYADVTVTAGVEFVGSSGKIVFAGDQFFVEVSLSTTDYWVFTDAAETYAIKVSGGNITINNFFTDNHLDFTVQTSGACTVDIVTSLGRPSSVNVASIFNAGTNTLSVPTSNGDSITVEWRNSLPYQIATTRVSDSVWIAFNFIALIPMLLGLTLLIVTLKTGEMPPTIIGVIIFTFVVSLVGIIVTNAVLSGM